MVRAVVPEQGRRNHEEVHCALVGGGKQALSGGHPETLGQQPESAPGAHPAAGRCGRAGLVRSPGRGGFRLPGAHRREHAQTLRAGRLRVGPPIWPPKRLDGRQEVALIAVRLGPPPTGHGRWSLRLLAREAVEIGIRDTINHETVDQTLDKMAGRYLQYRVIPPQVDGECVAAMEDVLSTYGSRTTSGDRWSAGTNSRSGWCGSGAPGWTGPRRSRPCGRAAMRTARRSRWCWTIPTRTRGERCTRRSSRSGRGDCGSASSSSTLRSTGVG